MTIWNHRRFRSGLITPGDMADAMEYLLGQAENAIVDVIRMRRAANAPW